jgi:hypothetical protein
VKIERVETFMVAPRWLFCRIETQVAHRLFGLVGSLPGDASVRPLTAALRGQPGAGTDGLSNRLSRRAISEIFEGGREGI